MGKRTIVDGRPVDLRSAASAYRVLVLGIGLGLCAQLLPLLLSGWLLGWQTFTVEFVLFLWPLQVPAAVTMALGILRANRALGETDQDCGDRAAVCGTLGLVPVFGWLPAALMTGKLHRILNSVGVPLGLLGPSGHTVSLLCPGICRTCGYDLALLPTDRCPECNADITCDKAADGAALTTVKILPANARSLARTCRCTAGAGIGLGFVQLVLCVTPIANLPNPALLVFLLPGLVFGAIAGTVAFIGNDVLRESWTANFVAVGIVAIILPPVAGVLLFHQAARLSTAADRRQAG